jgi:hypothetical protein
MPLNEDIFGATLKPHRERGSVGSEYFDPRLALESHRLRIKDFTSRGSKKMAFQRDCVSFSNFQCCVLEIVLEPQSAGHLKLLPVGQVKISTPRGQMRATTVGYKYSTVNSKYLTVNSKYWP